MKTIIINGYNLGYAKTITGIQRACHELIFGLDELLENSDLIVKYVYDPNEANELIPPSKFKNIIPLPYPIKSRRFFGKTRTLKKVLRKEKGVLCCLCLEAAVVRPKIAFIYDIRPVVAGFDTPEFKRKYRFFLFLQKISTRRYLTDSNFQKYSMAKYLHVNERKITTIYMGYEHFADLKSDESIFDRVPVLKDKDFYYAVGSLAPHKNFKWIAEIAKKNSDKLFAIAGGKDLSVWKDNVEIKDVSNLLFLGYVSDEESKALMQKCKAFLHPSKYEGFGIPPLEALCSGAKIIISNATCLPEIYEDCAVYFDPDDYDVNLDELTKANVAAPTKVLEKCSWKASAHLFLSVLEEEAKK